MLIFVIGGSQGVWILFEVVLFVIVMLLDEIKFYLCVSY